jgi:hypothetical protein
MSRATATGGWFLPLSTEVHMTRTTRIFIAIGIAAALGAPACAGAGNGEAADLSEKAAQLMLGADPTDAQFRQGFQAVLDAVTELGPEAKLSTGFASKIAEARRRISEVSLLDGKAVGLLSECYGEVHGGASFRMPETVRTRDDAVEYIRGRLGSVRELLTQGKPDEAVRRMLEALLAVTTPMEAPM